MSLVWKLNYEFCYLHWGSVLRVQPTRCNVALFIYLFISLRRYTCFRRFFRPSSGAQNCTYSVKYLSDRYCYLTLYVQFWAHDDGRKNRLKHVERLTDINKLWDVASFWLYSVNKLATHGHMNVKFKNLMYIGTLEHWYVQWLQGGCQVRLVGSASMDGFVAKRTHPWTHYLPPGLDSLPAAAAHTNTRLKHHAIVSSWWWAHGCPKHVEQLLEEK